MSFYRHIHLILIPLSLAFPLWKLIFDGKTRAGSWTPLAVRRLKDFGDGRPARPVDFPCGSGGTYLIMSDAAKEKIVILRGDKKVLLGQAVNMLGVGPQGLGGDSTAFAVHVETAATHITMNPVAVNMQCHSARRARATFRPSGVEYGF